MTTQSSPVVTVCDGVVTTLSTDVACFFEKRHNDVIRAIENIIATLPTDRLRNFAQTEVTRESPLQKGALIKSKAYRLTRDGFTFLAMGFTGAKAQAFKWAYIDAFNRMEAQLRTVSNPALACDTITPNEQHAIQVAVAKRARRTASNYQTIYRAIKNRYQIARYDQLPRSQFQDCLVFIDEVDLSVPESNPAVREPDSKIRKGMYLSDAQANTLRNFVYCINYLFRDDFQMIYKLMCQFESPKRAHFYEVFNNFTAMMLENTLAQAGYSVTELDCYKYWATKNA